jgi:hypothetical protein
MNQYPLIHAGIIDAIYQKHAIFFFPSICEYHPALRIRGVLLLLGRSHVARDQTLLPDDDEATTPHVAHRPALSCDSYDNAFSRAYAIPYSHLPPFKNTQTLFEHWQSVQVIKGAFSWHTHCKEEEQKEANRH